MPMALRPAILLPLLICLSLSVSAHAAQQVLGIVTGPKTGTYYAFSKDIANAAKKVNIHVEVKESEGSIDNIKRINSGENAALGIVQSDVLGFLARSKNPDSIRMASNLRMIFPFYNEEIHVLARKSIKSFSDLNGKNVAIGDDGSGNMLTSINLFSMMNVVPADMKKIAPPKGVVAVLKGELDAVIFVAGKPVRLFKNLEDLSLPENKKYAGMLEQVHFLALDSPKMLEEYRPATITHDDYNFVDGVVNTVAVQSVMVAYDFSKKENKKRCDMLADLGIGLRNALPELKEKGHPKWKEVDLDADTGIWKKDGCVWPGADEKNKSELLKIIDKK